MNPLEHQLQYPFGEEQPGPGTVREVAPGTYWIRLPLPFALDHVNVWLVRDEIDGRQGWTLIDCGISRDEVKAQWEQIFDQALQGLPVLRVVVTHMHPDHVGLADWICKRWNAPLFMSMTDYALARLWTQPDAKGSAAGGEAAVAHYARHGLNDADSQEKIRQRATYYSGLVPSMPQTFHRLMHGYTLRIGGRDWKLLLGCGHAPEHISLYDPRDNVLVSGDMVLPRISTNVSVFDTEPDANPLQLYLDTLSNYNGLPDDALVLPSHGRPFVGLHARIAQQRSHHADRLHDVIEACGERACSASDIVPVLFKRKLDLHQLTFAMGEALAHLHALYFSGKLSRSFGEDGIIRFRTV